MLLIACISQKHYNLTSIYYFANPILDELLKYVMIKLKTKKVVDR